MELVDRYYINGYAYLDRDIHIDIEVWASETCVEVVAKLALSEARVSVLRLENESIYECMYKHELVVKAGKQLATNLYNDFISVCV